MTWSIADFSIFDFTETVLYYSSVLEIGYFIPALEVTIHASDGRRIEQFNLGSGLLQTDRVFHLDLNSLRTQNSLAILKACEFDATTGLISVSHDYMEFGDVRADVMYVAPEVGNSSLLVVCRPTGSPPISVAIP